MKYLVLSLQLAFLTAEPGAVPAPDGQLQRENAAVDPQTMEHALQFMHYNLRAEFSSVSIDDAQPSVRQVQGQVVDHIGKPISDVIVVFVHSDPADRPDIYRENVSVTDKTGRFICRATSDYDLLAFRDPSGHVWTAIPDVSDEQQLFSRAEPGMLKWTVPPSLVAAGDEIAIHGAPYSPSGDDFLIYASVQEDGVVQQSLMPGHYYLTTAKSSPGGRWNIEIGPINVVPGQAVQPAWIRGSGTIVGPGIPCDEACHFIIQREGCGLNHSSSRYQLKGRVSTNGCAAEVIIPDPDDGFFMSQRLMPGRYLVHQFANRVLNVPARSIKTWRVSITDQRQAIRLAEPVYEDSLSGKIQRILDERIDYSGLHHLLYALSDDPDVITQELVLAVLDSNTPAKTCRVLQTLLIEEAPETETLVKGLLQIRDAYHKALRSRGWAFEVEAKLGEVQEYAGLIVGHLRQAPGESPYDLSLIEELARNNPEFRDTLSEMLMRHLPKMNARRQNAAILTLGRMGAPDVLSDLKVIRDAGTEHSIVAAFLIWQLDHDADAFLTVAHQVLTSRALIGKLEACQYASHVCQQYPASELLKSAVRKVAETNLPPELQVKELAFYGRLLVRTVQEARQTLATIEAAEKTPRRP